VMKACRIAMTVLTLAMVLMLCGAAQAEDIELSAQVDRSSLSLGEQMTLSVTVKGDVQGVPEPTMPPLPDFAVVSRFQSQNVEIVNFQTTMSITYQYILQPRRAGTFTIKPISLTYDGATYSTEPIKIEVTRQGAIPHPFATPSFPTPSFPTIPHPPPHPGFPPAMPFPFPVREPRGRVVAFSTLDKKTAYVNEQVVLTVDFCYPADLPVENRIFPPSGNGFLIEEVPPARKYPTMVRGERYIVEETKYALFPIQEGTLTVGSITVNYQVQDPFAGGADSIKTDPLELSATGIPRKEAPRDYTGAVGKFTIAGALSPAETPMDEPVTLSLTISGQGNISTLEAPKLPDLDKFKKFDTTESHTMERDGATIKGTKVFKTVLLPRQQGDLTIPAISFSYFDPLSKRFQSLATEPLTVKVAPAKHGGASPSPASTGQGEHEPPKADIRYIKSSFKPAAGRETPLYRRPLYLLIMALPLIVSGMLFILFKRKEYMERDSGKIKKSKAYGNFRRSLGGAEKELMQKHYDTYYMAVHRGLVEYLRDKLNLPGTGLTIQQIRDFLEDNKVNPEALIAMEEILRICENARFSPTAQSDSECRENTKKALKVVHLLEKKGDKGMEKGKNGAGARGTSHERV
jgi:hypothetical protein